MFYCRDCGVLRFLNRPENRNKPSGPMVEVECNYCNKTTIHRVLVPEDFKAANNAATLNSFKKIYYKLHKEIETAKEEMRTTNLIDKIELEEDDLAHDSDDDLEDDIEITMVEELNDD